MKYIVPIGKVLLFILLAGCGGGALTTKPVAPVATPDPPAPQPTPPPVPTPPMPVTTPVLLGPGGLPQVAVDSGGRVYIAWGAPTSVNVAKSTDNGATWTQTQVAAVPELPSWIVLGIGPDDSLSLLWWVNDETTGGLDVSYGHSPDGVVWSVAALPAVQGTEPRLLLTSDAITVAWIDTNLYLLRSVDGGQTFSGPTTGWNADGQDAGDLVTAQNYLAWTAADCNIEAATLVSGAVASPIQVSEAGTCGNEPALAVDALGAINVTWHNGGNSLSYARSTNQASTFSIPVTVASPNVPFIGNEQIAVEASGTVNVIWEQSGYSVMEASSADTFNFNPPAILSLPVQPGFTGAGDPAIATACGSSVATWDDDGASTQNGMFDIFAQDFGDVSNTPNQSEIFPKIAAGSDQNVFLTWKTTPVEGQTTPEQVSVLQKGCPQ